MANIRGGRDDRGGRGGRGRGRLPHKDNSAPTGQAHDSCPVSSQGTTYSLGRRIIVRGGFSGSTSHVGRVDATVDMNGVLHRKRLQVIPDHDYVNHDSDEDFDHGEDSDHEDDVAHPSQRDSSVADAPHQTSRKRLIHRDGDKFEEKSVNKNILRILREHQHGPWATFQQVPRTEWLRMFDRFKNLYELDPANEEINYEGFLNVIRPCYREIMRRLRVKSTKSAYDDGMDIDPKNFKQFNVIRDYPPPTIPFVLSDLE